MSKVVVIGSNSFSGSHFIDFLLEKTKYEILGISRSPEKSSLFLPYKRNKNSKRFAFYQLDLNRNMPAIINLSDQHEPAYVVNFASQSEVGASWNNPAHWYHTNVISTIGLIEELKLRHYLKKYVHISTPEVYGTCSGLVQESTTFNPSTPYAGSRAAADQYILMQARKFNFPGVFTRAANVYGAGQQLFKIIPRSVIYIKKGKKIPLHGGGAAKRSFIHIKDVCEATLSIMEKAPHGEIYHLSTDALTQIKDIVGKISDKLNVKFEEVTENVQERLGLDEAYILDSSKAKREFGWRPKIDLECGIDEVIQWINDNWSDIDNEPLEYMHKE
ncbi:GDP-mannose 4,6-dehydratase [Candidatus Woesearchaeota archaeon]|nr:GDP-mannose 4,6-dehydratase [Candidatus Woesearchaeota archaeon]